MHLNIAIGSEIASLICSQTERVCSASILMVVNFGRKLPMRIGSETKRWKGDHLCERPLTFEPSTKPITINFPCDCVNYQVRAAANNEFASAVTCGTSPELDVFLLLVELLRVRGMKYSVTAQAWPVWPERKRQIKTRNVGVRDMICGGLPYGKVGDARCNAKGLKSRVLAPLRFLKIRQGQIRKQWQNSSPEEWCISPARTNMTRSNQEDRFSCLNPWPKGPPNSSQLARKPFKYATRTRHLMLTNTE